MVLPTPKHEDEALAVERLLAANRLSAADCTAIRQAALDLVRHARGRPRKGGTLDGFLQEFGLSTAEGVSLMCLAEALLRIPDADTRDALIAERVLAGDWSRHLGASEDWLVNAGTWALMLTGRLVELEDEVRREPAGWLKHLVRRSSEPVIRAAVARAMKIIGGQFVFAPTIGEALDARHRHEDRIDLYSFDMLGEGARTAAAAEGYEALYRHAIESLGAASGEAPVEPQRRSSISIKLSALHPRYEALQRERVLHELYERLLRLATLARGHGLQLTLDAEEADRLELSLELFERLCAEPSLSGWDGLGLAVQAYQKRALGVVESLAALARRSGRRIPVRLVKGAYWDSEIKLSQQAGHADYPVYTRKAATDFSYLVCAQRLMDCEELLPQFATHNAHTIAAVEHLARSQPGRDYEYQRLHGMGEPLYEAARETLIGQRPVRTYAPVGHHRELLPYLVRRLLENGANSGFVNRFLNARLEADEVVQDPVAEIQAAPRLRPSHIPPPPRLYGEQRRNARGLDLSDEATAAAMAAAVDLRARTPVEASCLIGDQTAGAAARPVTSPADRRRVPGSVREAGPAEVSAAVSMAQQAFKAWNARGGGARATLLQAMADALEGAFESLAALLVLEAGRSWPDAVAEVREAIDFCRYYAVQAAAEFAPQGQRLPGPTGERNTLHWVGRGVFACISPWNFPLSIFTGQLAAALAAGNTVVAKPAPQTPLIAYEAVRLFRAAGLPAEVLGLLPGDGAVGAALIADARIAGVAFTGSTATARSINRQLAAREGAIVPLIAETGGQNAMVVDSTALLEQVVDDVLLSAFSSAGQRCSALRVLLVQRDIAEELIGLIRGALAERRIGDTAAGATDIGPVIDEAAQARLRAHAERMMREATPVCAAALPPAAAHGSYFAPQVFEIEGLTQLTGEVFGPILHLLRYERAELPRLLDELVATGYGLTFGIHTRLETRARWLFERSVAGNTYVNRSMIGAVVGVQPFGGTGLSGTGPKAGGPHYLHRFGTERTLSVNTAAVGGNAELFGEAQAQSQPPLRAQ